MLKQIQSFFLKVLILLTSTIILLVLVLGSEVSISYNTAKSRKAISGAWQKYKTGVEICKDIKGILR